MSKIAFVTTNKHKFKEVSGVLKEFGVEIEQVIMEYDEDKEKSMEEIVVPAAKMLANKLNREVIIDDTGLFFKAYNNFPGALPKYIFNAIGYDGIFRLLAGLDRSAYFETFIGYCKPGGETKTFKGIMEGKIIEKIINAGQDHMCYDRIFIPKGHDKTISEMTLKKKNSFSQRAHAIRLLGEFLAKN